VKDLSVCSFANLANNSRLDFMGLPGTNSLGENVFQASLTKPCYYLPLRPGAYPINEVLHFGRLRYYQKTFDRLEMLARGKTL
jgi:hypothetical protein